MKSKMIRLFLLSVAPALLTACAVQPVQPWEKGYLAKPEMTFEADKLDTDFVEHTYSSKEAASGGAGVGGGGCGCN
jgi:outer membrane biogenesis lipoprotein LolB